MPAPGPVSISRGSGALELPLRGTLETASLMRGVRTICPPMELGSWAGHRAVEGQWCAGVPPGCLGENGVSQGCAAGAQGLLKRIPALHCVCGSAFAFLDVKVPSWRGWKPRGGQGACLGASEGRAFCGAPSDPTDLLCRRLWARRTRACFSSNSSLFSLFQPAALGQCPRLPVPRGREPHGLLQRRRGAAAPPEGPSGRTAGRAFQGKGLRPLPGPLHAQLPSAPAGVETGVGDRFNRSCYLLPHLPFLGKSYF